MAQHDSHTQAQSDLPPKLARRLAGICQHCSDPAMDGSDFCAPHDAKEKGSRRVRQRKLRQARADAGRCSAGCGEKVGKQRRADGSVLPRRCSACAKEHAKHAKATRARVCHESRSCVTGDEPTAPSVKLEVGKDGATRTRYVPRAGQGGPSKEETRKARRKMVADALRLAGVWQANDDDATHDAIDAMPRVQRAEARSLKANALVRAGRLLLLAAEEEDPALKGTCSGCGRARDEDDE